MKLNNYGILTAYHCVEKIKKFKDQRYMTLYYNSFNVFYVYNSKEIEIARRDYRKDWTSYSTYGNELIILFDLSGNEMKEILRYIFKYDEEGSKCE